MRTPCAALAGLLVSLAVLTACSSGARFPVTNQPVTNQPVTNQPVTNQVPANPPPTLGDHARPGDVLLTVADNERTVTVTVGQTLAANVPGAFSVFISDSGPQPVLNALGGGRFRAVGPGQAELAAEFYCAPGASCAMRWLVAVIVRAG
jgi:hypothetical protein